MYSNWMRKLRPRALWEGREAEQDWEIHRTDITSVSSGRTGKEVLLAVAISGLRAWGSTDVWEWSLRSRNPQEGMMAETTHGSSHLG